MGFVHLQVNTEYSLLKGAAKIETLVRKAKELKFSALAITDQNVMYGVVPFYKECKKQGIKPIIGLELTITEGKDRSSRLLLLAKSYKGYQNLIKLSSVAQVFSTSSVVQVPKKYLSTYSQDLIAISPAYQGEIQQFLENGEEELAIQKVADYQKYFGQDFFVGIQDHLLATEKQLNLKLAQLSQKGIVKLVVLNQVMYVNKEDALAHKCLLAIDQGTTLQELIHDFETEEYYLKSQEQMERLFAYLPKALANTKEIADLCQVELCFGGQLLPKFQMPEKEDTKSYIQKLCYQGLKNRYQNITKEMEERLQYELKIIDQMQFNDYFLIVWDFMKFAHDQGMITGPGRGSAAGSLVAYVLNITNVDPIHYDLLFERFLNPERISMPDIDIDFPDTRREEVIEYVYQKYGRNHVAQIITFGTLAAKAALRDVGKVIGIPLKQIDQIAKLIPSRPNVTIEEAVKEIDIIKKQLLDNQQMREWFHLAQRVEGVPRHASTHAAGIVISEEPLTEQVPLQKGHTDVLLTQYPMNTLEEIGLLKMDFLGLRNLSFIEEIISHIQKREGKKVNLQKIPIDDKETFQLLGKGDTTGIFQLESPGMRRILTQLKPTEFEDIVAVIALYRPGPMGNIPLYIDGKHNKRQIPYVHKDLAPILEKTYGVIIYQEQIMQIASKMAGFSLGEADILRRAVSKKKLETLEKQRENFVQGCRERGYSEKIANDVYDLIVRFANYGFNRSHSVAYSIISYQLAYLKANFSTAFFAALFTSAIGQQYKIRQYILDAKQKGIEVLSPSINDSFAEFTILDSGKIQFGLAAIKNVGIRAIEEIVSERKKEGKYKDIYDFCARISSKYINRRALEALVCSGCFDEFGHHRAGFLASLDYALEYGEKMKQLKTTKQTSLFVEEINKPSLEVVPPFKEAEKLFFEKEVLGFYFSSHPIEEFLDTIHSIGRITISEAINKLHSQVVVAGLIESLRMIKTKKGEQMAFLKLSDESAEIEITVFPKIIQDHYTLVKVGQLVLFRGKLDISKERTQLIASEIIDVLNVKKTIDNQVMYLKIQTQLENQSKLLQLKKLLKSFPGNVRVILYYDEKKQSVQLSDNFNVSASNQCIESLTKMLGKGNVVLKQ